MFYFHRQAEAELLCLQCLILPCINSLFSLSCCLGPRSYPVLKKIMLFMLLFLLLSSVGYGEFHICLCLYLLESMGWHHPESSIILDLIFQHVILSADFCLTLCNLWERKEENGGRETFLMHSYFFLFLYKKNELLVRRICGFFHDIWADKLSWKILIRKTATRKNWEIFPPLLLFLFSGKHSTQAVTCPKQNEIKLFIGTDLESSESKILPLLQIST